MAPTFCAKFADGITTRMSIHCPKGLDPERGVLMSRFAYVSRTKKKTPPKIVEAHFETPEGVMLKRYGADEIDQTNTRKPRNRSKANG
jgi:hypothetical protein